MTANRGLILHHAVANGSLFALFNTPSSQVSTQFWVGRQLGQIEQYVDSEVVAWATGSGEGNSTFCSVETEGCTTPPYAEPMTDAMIDNLAALYREGAVRHGWPNALADSAGVPGFGYHRLWSATACPCDVRVNMRSTILNRAFWAPPTPSPTPRVIRGKDGDTMTSLEDETFLHVWGPHPTTGAPMHWWQFLPGKGDNPKGTNWYVEAMPLS